MQNIDRMYPARAADWAKPNVLGLLLMLCVTVLTSVLLIWSFGSFEEYPYSFLLPWLGGLAIVISLPLLWIYWRGEFSFADPLVFAAVSYFVPAFVIGGIFFAGGWSDPSFLFYIQDAPTTLPWTVVLIGLGFVGLSAGYLIRVGPFIGSYIGTKISVAEYPPEYYLLPATLLLLIGTINTFMAFAVGLFGYQYTDQFSEYDGLIFISTLFWSIGAFILCLCYFRLRHKTVGYFLSLIMLISTSIARAVFAGNRGTIVQIFMVVLLSYLLSGRRFGIKHSVVAAFLLIAGLMVGMIYGTSFRQVKGTQARQDIGQYTDDVIRTFEDLGRTDLSGSVEFGFASLTGRLDILSTVAVVVSNYEELAPYEEAYGLDSNIWVDTTTFIVPRAIWKDKPYASDPRRYSELYFDAGETSFAITPIGDLLRNYGVAGVFIGMFILGLLLRAVQKCFASTRMPTVIGATMYFILLTSVSYEGFYGTIIPTMVKNGLVALLGLVFANWMTKLVYNRRIVSATQ